MPTSADEGKPWIIDAILRTRPASLVDVGAGSGTYARLLRPHLPYCRMTAIEVFVPYVDRFGLDSLYDEMIIGDVRETDLPAADVIVMGDVIEHMDHTEAVELWNRSRQTANVAVFVSLPIIEYPQGAVYGNHHEAHLHTWDHDQVMALGGVVDHWTGTQIGVYQVAPLPIQS